MVNITFLTEYSNEKIRFLYKTARLSYQSKILFINRKDNFIIIVVFSTKKNLNKLTFIIVTSIMMMEGTV